MVEMVITKWSKSRTFVDISKDADLLYTMEYAGFFSDHSYLRHEIIRLADEFECQNEVKVIDYTSVKKDRQYSIELEGIRTAIQVIIDKSGH